MNEYVAPAEVFPPGEFIREEMDERGWSQADLAEILGRPVQVVNEILSAKKMITPDTAREFAAAFGTSPGFFLNLENAYRLSLSKTETSKVARRSRIYAKAPVRELIKRGWITNVSDIEKLELEVCNFLNISALDDEPSASFAARKGDGYDAITPGQLAWFCRCRHLAHRRMPTAAFDLDAFRRIVQDLPKEFPDETNLERLPEVLSRRGLGLVLLEHLPSTKIDGAAFWLDGRPFVALSVRYDRVDSFWFTLMHELAHIVLHGFNHANIDVNLVGPSVPAGDAKPLIEQQADQQAVEWLVPRDELSRFIAETKPCYSHDRIVRFAQRLGIHCGVVVGQLQHRGEIGWGHSRKFLVKVRHILPMES
jgi:HTH-type transcriptional regulator/antitoxin HigA